MNKPRSILNPVEQRVLGVVRIVEGIAWVAIGDRTPSLSLAYIKKKVKEKNR